MNTLMMAVLEINLVVPIACLLLGIILMLIEIFQPGFGIFGVLGIISMTAGVVLRALSGGSPMEILLTVLAIALFFTVTIMLAVKSAKSGRLSKTALILNDSSVPQDRTTATGDYTYLLGQEGIATTFLRPVGKAKINDKTVEVIAEDGEVIESGAKVKVIFVEGQRVIVKNI